VLATFSRRTILAVDRHGSSAKLAAPERNSTVALVKGESRRKSIAQALTAIWNRASKAQW
jgi:hypothetical protein